MKSNKEYIVYPRHGVCEVTGTDVKTIGGQRKEFTVLKSLNKEMILIVPTDSFNQYGIRPLMQPSVIPIIDAILKSDPTPPESLHSWNRRYRDNMECISSGSLIKVATVIRDLNHLKTCKDLSFGEHKMLDFANSILNQELNLIKESI